MLKKITQLALASILDWWMTIMLIGQCIFYENNVVANAFHEKWGYIGLIFYKIPPMLVIVIITTWLQHLKHKKMAFAILDWGTLITLGVVFYSFSLFITR